MGVFWIGLLLTALSAPPADPGLDIGALNQCVETAAARGEAWTRTPIGIIGYLFGVSGECVVAGEGAPDSTTTASMPTVTFRPAREGLPYPDRWLAATLRPVADGTWRIAALDVADSTGRPRRTQGFVLGGPPFNFGSRGPLEFLEYLRNQKRRSVAVIAPRDWIKEKDLPGLVALVDSPDSCAAVISPLSSAMARTRSTVGIEAAYLIEGYRAGTYPPGLVSMYSHADVAVIKAWWAQALGVVDRVARERAGG